MPNPDLLFGLDLTVRIAAAGLVLSGAEMLALGAQWALGGTFSPAVVSALHARPPGFQFFDRWLRPLLLLQVGGALVLLAVGPFSPTGRLALALTFCAFLAVRWRRHLGGDGAEQMIALILAAACLAALPVPSEARLRLAAIFLAAQLCLSYTTAGVAKLISPLWRSGAALPAILATSGHGHPAAAALFQRRPSLALAACWAVILFECLFPLAFLGPAWLVAAALIIGFGFHLACAVLMGLNSFLWAFPAVYPSALAVWWTFLR